MRTIYDQLSKGLLEIFLRGSARMETEREIPGFVLSADVWLEPDSAARGRWSRLGVLGRMLAGGPSLLESYSRVPGGAQVRSCILKQYALDRSRAGEAERKRCARPDFAPLWLLSPGRPESLMEPLELRPMAGWPSGFWHTRPFDPLRLVIIRALPETPDTAFLRMFGRGKTFARALRELATLPDNSWFIEPLKSLVLALGLDIPQTGLMQNADADWRIEMEAIQRTYNEWKEDTLQEGRREGLQEGLERGMQQGLERGVQQG
ncbi:MAG: hypothetical protein AAGC55_13385, partial [Myxococcota bacterium]